MEFGSCGNAEECNEGVPRGAKEWEWDVSERGPYWPVDRILEHRELSVGA